MLKYDRLECIENRTLGVRNAVTVAIPQEQIEKNENLNTIKMNPDLPVKCMDQMYGSDVIGLAQVSFACQPFFTSVCCSLLISCLSVGLSHSG